MPVPLIIVAAISIAGTVASTAAKKNAANQAAVQATSVADYNNRLDQSQAAQIDLDTQENIRALRADAATYMSRQVAAYVGAGVVANTGSPLVVQAATAGKMEMRAQEMWRQSQAKEEYLYSQGKQGVAVGQAQADAYKMAGNAAVMEGAAKVASQIYGAYSGGAFTGIASTGTTDLSAGLSTYGGGATEPNR